MAHSTSDEAEQRVQRVLEQGLERVQTPQAAKAVVARVERLCCDLTEQDRAAAAATEHHAAAQAAATIERAAQQPSTPAAVADVLAKTAVETVAPTPAAPHVLQAAQSALTPSAPVSPPAARGRQLLKEAVLRRMNPLQALDARVYLEINSAPHPGWLDSLAWAIAIVFMGGWIWVISTLLAYLLRVPASFRAFKLLLPSVVGATWIVEYPVKAFFRRRRPFVEIVRALVIGKKPGSWSFPSGHTASSFASAVVLSSVWPQRAPAFFGVAASVGFSRIYVGAHYPGDVLSGAFFGSVIAELIRRGVASRLAA
jgi:undecaprenyl-diphosphatase